MMTSITKQDVGSSLKPHLESQLSQLVTYSEEKGIAIDDHLGEDNELYTSRCLSSSPT
jgi:hypothetical protein